MRSVLREVLTKRHNVLRDDKVRLRRLGIVVKEQPRVIFKDSRQDLDATRYLVLHRISIRKIVQRQRGISTMGRVIKEHDRMT